MSRKAKPSVRIPSTALEVSGAIDRFKELTRTIERKSLTANSRIAKLQAELVAETAPLQSELEEVAEALRQYGTAHRASLTDHGRRQSAEFGTGRLGWRISPPRVELRQVESIIDRLKREGPAEFLRMKIEINREAMLAKPEQAESIPGVAIVQDELFYVWPDEFDTEVMLAKAKRRSRAN